VSGEEINRTAHWLLSVESAPEAPGAVFEAECLTCGEKSGPADNDRLPAEIWTLQHAGETDHRNYAENVRRYWRATPLGGA
jgi:hypothetical protein